MRELNRFYLQNPAMYQDDYLESGFTWLDCHQEERCIYAFERRCENQRLVFVFNLSGNVQQDYTLKIEGCRQLQTLLDTSLDKYGGTKTHRDTVLVPGADGVKLTLAP